MAPSDSSLGRCDPSPADSVSACTTCVVQPAGVAPTSPAAASSGSRNAGVRERRSTTSLRFFNASSTEHHIQHFGAIEQLGLCDRELPLRPLEHELEHAIVVMVEDLGLRDAKPVGKEGGLQPLERDARLRSNRALVLALHAQQPA